MQDSLEQGSLSAAFRCQAWEMASGSWALRSAYPGDSSFLQLFVFILLCLYFYLDFYQACLFESEPLRKGMWTVKANSWEIRCAL